MGRRQFFPIQWLCGSIKSACLLWWLVVSCCCSTILVQPFCAFVRPESSKVENQNEQHAKKGRILNTHASKRMNVFVFSDLNNNQHFKPCFQNWINANGWRQIKKTTPLWGIICCGNEGDNYRKLIDPEWWLIEENRSRKVTIKTCYLFK